ncbi:hypothetical protein JOD82_001841 [Paenibacillus sp. 1182]|uniref:BC1872 family protein n=1 Tax=Paenibacillus sp. 1182 TaxID=2806565 RepID=UPI001AEAC7CA|nr:hypothetical protein [Paenibacillus sp. 1182]MBP1308821.1 hypothetical protein [Paenibacillus sp. 1182]
MRDVDMDRLIIVDVLQMEDLMVVGEDFIGLKEPSGEVRAFKPSQSMDDAMEAAKFVHLFEDGYILHYIKGAFTQRWVWQISSVTEDGIQGFTSGDTPALAICMACLLKSGLKK